MLIDTDGSIISHIPPEEWANYINELVASKAYIQTQRKVSAEEEAIWLTEKINEIKHRNLAIVLEMYENRLIGTCEVRKKSQNVYFGLSVRPAYQRRGIGENLLRKGIEIAKTYFNAKNMFVEVAERNTAAYNLYKKLGFKEVARYLRYFYYYGAYLDTVVMKV